MGERRRGVRFPGKVSGARARPPLTRGPTGWKAAGRGGAEPRLLKVLVWRGGFSQKNSLGLPPG